MSDRVKWCLKIYGYLALITAVVIAVIGFVFGKIIEGTLFAEVSKWVVMGLVIVLVVLGLAYVPVSLLAHRREKLYPKYGKDWFKALLKGQK